MADGKLAMSTYDTSGHWAVETKVDTNLSDGVSLDFSDVGCDLLVIHCLCLVLVMDKVDLPEGYSFF